MKSATSSTLVAVKRITIRPYRVNVEIRARRDGKFAVTLVTRSEKIVSLLSRRLRQAGYDYILYFDSYKYVRLHVTGLSPEEVSHVEAIVNETLKNAKRGELVLASA